MCLIFVGMDVLTCCGLLLCCWLVCDRFLDQLLSFVGSLLWISPSNLLYKFITYLELISIINNILRELPTTREKIYPLTN